MGTVTVSLEPLPAPPVICDCDCGCEPDGEWHFTEIACVCRALNCPCVTDVPGPGITPRPIPPRR